MLWRPVNKDIGIPHVHENVWIEIYFTEQHWFIFEINCVKCKKIYIYSQNTVKYIYIYITDVKTQQICQISNHITTETSISCRNLKKMQKNSIMLRLSHYKHCLVSTFQPISAESSYKPWQKIHAASTIFVVEIQIFSQLLVMKSSSIVSRFCPKF